MGDLAHCGRSDALAVRRLTAHQLPPGLLVTSAVPPVNPKSRSGGGFIDLFIDHCSIRVGAKWEDTLRSSVGACGCA